MSLVNANFREAIKSGDKEAIEREGAKKLQSVWRVKQAQKEVQARKDAFLDAAARKVQSCYRVRYAACRLCGCTGQSALSLNHYLHPDSG